METNAGGVIGVVAENHGAHFDVLIENRLVRCLLRGRLKKAKGRNVAAVAPGDRVRVRLLAPDQGVIEQVLPRAAGLSRRAAGSIPLQQTLAANVDQALIVFAAAEPRPDYFMLDRFLVAAAAADLRPIVCFNKCDLAAPGLRSRSAIYSQVADRVLYTSALRGEGLCELRDLLQGRASVICGPSGVGKSSLLNAIAPGLELRTGEVGSVTHKGRHTTSSITLLPLPFGGWVADTPGLRQLPFWEVTPEQVASGFPDLHPHLGRCRFPNCAHRADRGCRRRFSPSAVHGFPRFGTSVGTSVRLSACKLLRLRVFRALPAAF